MTSLVRRSVVNARNINNCRILSVLLHNENNKLIPIINNKQYKHTKTLHKHSQYVQLRSINTTAALDKVVAFKLSDIGEGIREVVVKEWFIKVGDKVQQFDNICEVQSDKAAVTITSRYDGVVTKLYHEVDQTALVGQPLVDIEVEDEEGTGSTVTTPVQSTEETPSQNTTSGAITDRVRVLTTPAVRRIAAQFQVDMSKVKATGRNGRLLKEDLLGYLNISSDESNKVPTQTDIDSRGTPVIPPKIDKPEVVAEDKIVPVTGFTKAMVKSMTEAMKIPHFVFSDEYDVSELVKARSKLKAFAEANGIKLSYMPFIVKATSLCLYKHPILNSSLDTACENIIYKASHNIGVAMDTPNGLVVPVIKNVQQKTILEIARDLNTLQEKGSKGQLSLSDVTGGTFALSNIGIIGGTYMKPVILPPQVSIGAIGKIQVLPRFDVSGNLIKAHILNASWSADHRVIDGVTMARFSEDLKAYLEEPYKLLLDL